jgi:hypothetical protein
MDNGVNISNLEKDFIRQKVKSVFIEQSSLRIYWSRSFVNTDTWVLMMSYTTPAPTQKIIRGTDIKCQNYSFIKVKEMISVKKDGFIEWQRERKLNKIL